MSKQSFVKSEKKPFVRKQRPIVGQVTLYKTKEMKPEDAWGVIVKQVDEKGYIDEDASAIYIPMTELKDLLTGRFWNAAAYVFEGKKQ